MIRGPFPFFMHFERLDFGLVLEEPHFERARPESSTRSVSASLAVRL